MDGHKHQIVQVAETVVLMDHGVVYVDDAIAALRPDDGGDEGRPDSCGTFHLGGHAGQDQGLSPFDRGIDFVGQSARSSIAMAWPSRRFPMW